MKLIFNNLQFVTGTRRGVVSFYKKGNSNKFDNLNDLYKLDKVPWKVLNFEGSVYIIEECEDELLIITSKSEIIKIKFSEIDKIKQDEIVRISL